MDIADLSISMSQASLAQQVDVSVAKIAMDNMDQTGANLTKMMELSVNPGLGSKFDASI
ncbi:MAG TPA: YjfB family protein [Ruminiclostridium sp.]|nr:YjfB family protein [Ruminiclostridium sp.]